MQVEIRLGELVLNGDPFKVLLPLIGVCKPQYEINPNELKEGIIIGHVVTLPAGQTFIISRITKIHHSSDEFSVIDWPSHVTTEPILHNWDTRKLEQLPVQTMFINLNSIQCILKKEWLVK